MAGAGVYTVETVHFWKKGFYCGTSRMLVISKHQKATLAADSYQRYLEHLAEMLREFDPTACDALGTDELRGFVSRAAQKASGLGLDIYGDIGKYVLLAFAIGEDFETNSAHAWAGAIVRNPDFKSPSEMIQELYRQAEERLGQDRG